MQGAGLADLERNCPEILEAFGGRVRIELFFSRYHPALSTEDLHDELGQLLGLKLRLLLAKLPVHCCFDHLSTDVASRYWLEHQRAPHLQSLETKEQTLILQLVTEGILVAVGDSSLSSRTPLVGPEITSCPAFF